MKHLRTAAFAIGALLLGLFGLGLVFSDLGPGEVTTSRVIIAVVFFFFSGAVIGFFNPAAWMISGMTAWGAVLVGVLITFAAVRRYGADAFTATEPPYISAGLVILFVPVILSLAGGFLARRLRQARAASVTH